MYSFNNLPQVPLATKTLSYSSNNHKPFYPSQSKPNQIGRNIEDNFKILLKVSSPKFVQLCASNPNAGIEVENCNFPRGLLPEKLPKHVAVSIDGMKSSSPERGFPTLSDYGCIGPKTKMLANMCADFGIKVCTVLWLSSRNLSRPKGELDFLFSLFEEILRTDVEEYSRRDIKISIIGERSNLPNSLQRLVTLVEESTKHNAKLHLLIALNYSGREDITKAAKRIAQKIHQNLLSPDNIDGSIISKEMETYRCGEFCDPDLIITTGGEQTVGNFFLWQSSYTELYFADRKFPDFEEADFVEALLSFQGRQRRFGAHDYKTSEGRSSPKTSLLKPF